MRARSLILFTPKIMSAPLLLTYPQSGPGILPVAKPAGKSTARLRLTGIINYMAEIQKPDPANLKDHYPTLLAALHAAESRRQADAIVITELAKQALEALTSESL